MQKIRVTLRNIQFKESVQIREISRNDSESILNANETNKQSLWNPNLTNTEIFETKPTKQKYIVIGFIVGGIVLISAIIGTVVGIVFNQKTTIAADNSLTYNEVCKTSSNQCISSQGLSCSNGFCSCSSPYSWNTVITTCTLLTYNQACTTSNQCNSSADLTCNAGTCACPTGTSWVVANTTCVTIG